MSAPPPVVPLSYTADSLEKILGADWAVRLREAYGWMRFGRALDRRMTALQRQGRIGFYGASTGGEAVTVATGLVSARGDWIVPGLREQLIALVRGHPLGAYVDHLFANDRDPARGRQLPCHPTARDVHYVSMSSVVGTQITHAVGLGLAARRRKDPGVTFAFFGDGATSTNDFHAGLNFAGVWQVPLVFVCVNNQWAISVPVEHQSRVARLADKASAYGIDGRRVDGTDFVACVQSLESARASVVAGAGPVFLEFVIYRMTPHSTSDDPRRYQPEGWAAEALAHDPVRRLEELFDRLELVPQIERDGYDAQAETSIRLAIESAEKVPAPSPSSLESDVWAPTPARS